MRKMLKQSRFVMIATLCLVLVASMITLADPRIRARYCDSCFWSGCPVGDDASSFDGPGQTE